MAIPDEAREQLAQMIDQAATPPLSTAELDACLRSAALVDAGGRPPTDEDWTPTFDFPEAAAQACELRAAKAATSETLTSVTSEGTTLQVTPADWSALAAWWRQRSRAGSSPSVGVVGIDTHSRPGGWPRSAYSGPDVNWDHLPRAGIPGVIGNWS